MRTLILTLLFFITTTASFSQDESDNQIVKYQVHIFAETEVEDEHPRVPFKSFFTIHLADNEAIYNVVPDNPETFDTVLKLLQSNVRLFYSRGERKIFTEEIGKPAITLNDTKSKTEQR